MKLLAIDTSTDACSAALWLNGEVRQRYQVAPREHGQLILPMIESLLAEAGLALTQLDTLAFGRGPGGFTGVRIANSVIQGLAFGADLPVVPISSLAALAQGAYTEMGTPQILAAIDARIGEVYWGAYRAAQGCASVAGGTTPGATAAQGRAIAKGSASAVGAGCAGAAATENGLVTLVDKEIVCPPQQVPQPLTHDLDYDLTGEWFGVGNGWHTYAQTLKAHLGEAVTAWDGQHYPQARHLARLAADAYHRGLAVSAEQALPVYLRDEVAWKKLPLLVIVPPPK